MATSYQTPDCQEPAFALAIAVIHDRLRRLSKEDRDDLFSLIPLLIGDDEEEKQSAIVAADEILQQSSGKIQPLQTPEHSNENWLKFVSGQLRKAREDSGMTQGELAAKTGLQQSHISRLEKGEHSPTQKTLKKIAEALGVETSFFDPSA